MERKEAELIQFTAETVQSWHVKTHSTLDCFFACFLAFFCWYLLLGESSFPLVKVGLLVASRLLCTFFWFFFLYACCVTINSLKPIVFKITAKSILMITSSETGKERSKNISVTTETCVHKVGVCWYQLETEQLVICTSCHGFVPFDTADTLWCWSFLPQKPGRPSF